MPIYEFYCETCNTIFNFYSRSINTTKQPVCPRCRNQKLKRFLSSFSVLGESAKDEGEEPLPFDEQRMEKAIGALAREAESIDENDPRQAATVMRRLSDMAGLPLGKGMKEAIERMEAGEDPEKIEEEMGDILEEDPFELPEKRIQTVQSSPPLRDDKLYELEDY
ncbi:MAG: FmdB family zinc ribbon protein [Thermodesulfobacteriota bacterium]